MQTAEEAAQLDTQIKAVVDNMNSASILEGTGLEEGAELENLSFQKGQSSIQQTLDEIQSLRLIERELSSQKNKGNLEKHGHEIDPDSIEQLTLQKAKMDPDMKEDQIATMVEAQINDQVNRIEDKNTLNEGYAVLLYG